MSEYNILVDCLPRTVELGGMEVGIETNFRTSIVFEMLMLDDSVSDAEKTVIAVDLFYGDLPEGVTTEEAVDKIIWFYTCGKHKKNGTGSNGRNSGKAVYSFQHDCGYIYAAFMSQYGIDLQDVEYMHWWKFRALFDSLDEDVMFMKIMKYRAVDLTKKMSKEQKEFYQKMKKLYALPLSENEQERDDRIAQILMNGGDLSVLEEFGGTE